MAKSIRNLMIRLGLDVDPSGMSRLTKALDRADKKVGALGSKLRGPAMVTGLVAAGGAATSFAAAIAPAAVAAGVAMPAAMATSKVAAGTLKVALMGVGDAMSAVAEEDAKKLEEAIKKLSPNAKQFVRESAGFYKAFQPVRKAVQDRLFQGLSKEIDPLAKNLLPTARTGMIGVAGSLNKTAKEAAAFGQTEFAKGALNKIFAGTSGILNKASTAVQPFLRVVTNLVLMGQPLARRMTDWAVGGIKTADAFLRSRDGAAWMSQKVQAAGDLLARLGRIGRNIGVLLGNIFGQAGKQSGDFLGTLEQLTAKMAAWSKTAEGQQQIANTFKLLGDVFRQLVQILPIVMGPLGAIANLISTMPPDVQSVVVKVLAFATVAGLLGSKLGALSSVLFGGASKLIQFGGGLIKGSAGLASNATMAAKAGAALRTFGSTLSHGIMAAGQMVARLSAMAGAWALNTARTLASTVAQKAAAVASRVLAVAIRLVNAAMRANPIGIIITLIMGLVAIIVIAYKKNETFRKIVDAVWKGIQNAIKFAINNIIKPVIQWLYNFIVNTLGPKFMWFHNNVVRPVMNKVGEVIRTVVDKVKGHFMFMHKLITKTIPDGFRSGVSAIGRFWDKLISIAKTPVNFVIRLYNQGIGKMVNKLAEFVGIGARVPAIPYFANGGVLPGYSPGKDSLIAAVSPGESIFRPEFTKAVGPGFVKEGNRVAKTQGPSGVRKWMSQMGGEGLAFANGGTVPHFAGKFAFGGIIGNFIKGVKDFTIGNVAKGARTLLDKIIGGSVPGGGILKTIISAIPQWIKERIVSWVGKKIDTGGGGGPAVQRALRFAKAQHGKPYVWGGAGPGGYDCSGFMGAIWNVIKGRSPYSRVFSTHPFTGQVGPGGFHRNMRSGFTIGVTHAGVGHMAGTLGRTNVESRGSAGVLVGPSARGTTNGLFTHRYGLKFDQGGVMPPGHGAYYNGTRKPEYVFTQKQMASMGGGDHFEINITVSPGANVREFEDAVYRAIKKYKDRNGRTLRV